MTESRKKPGVTFWTTAVLALAVLYVASFGPACWLTVGRTERRKCPFPMIVYWPLGRAFVALDRGKYTPMKEGIRSALYWWITVGVPTDKDAIMMTGPNLMEIMLVSPPVQLPSVQFPRVDSWHEQ
jgi:hypothetical protein